MSEQSPNHNKSDVADLLQKIDAEYQSATRALRSFAYGVSQHKFISTRMERMRVMHEMIADKVGASEAIRLVCEQLDKSADAKES